MTKPRPETKPITCSICNSTIRSSKALRLHQIARHAQPSRHQCTHCLKYCTSTHPLLVHNRTHTVTGTAGTMHEPHLLGYHEQSDHITTHRITLQRNLDALRSSRILCRGVQSIGAINFAKQTAHGLSHLHEYCRQSDSVLS